MPDTFNLKIFWDDDLKQEMTSVWPGQLFTLFETHVKGHTKPKECEIRAIVSQNGKVIITHILHKENGNDT